MPSEKAIDMTNLLRKTLEEKQLDLNKMVSVCMDNTMSNFGGVLRRGQQNVFYFLKKEIPKLVGIGCPSHIAKNSVRRAIEQMDYDVTQIANTITSHFSNHALRWVKYQEFCEEFQHPVRTFPDFASTRWLSLGKLVEEIVRSWQPIEPIFPFRRWRTGSRLSKAPKALRKIFNDELTNTAAEYLALFAFCTFTLKNFNKFNTINQTPALPFPKLIKSLGELKQRLKFARDQEYYGAETAEFLEKLEIDGSGEFCRKLKGTFKKFHDDALEYLDR